jgi:hypothetical protein
MRECKTYLAEGLAPCFIAIELACDFIGAKLSVCEMVANLSLGLIGRRGG